MDNVVTTLATVPAVIALVTLAKDLGLPSRLSPVLAVVLGVALQLFDLTASGVFVDYPTAMQAVATGLILGLSASGLYDGAKLVGSRRPASPEETTARKVNDQPHTLF